jgi:SAM-dependent methyltransferase
MKTDTAKAARATSFGAAAEDYDRYRLGMPAEVADSILPSGASAVLDLGAGTGAMTRLLIERAAKVYAVDPDPRMTALLARSCPEVEVHEGTGEAIPLPDACVDTVVVASAWHWMDPAVAIPEIARVLRPGGTLCIVWNRRDRTVPWIADFEALRLEVTGGEDWIDERIRYYAAQPWLPAGSPFTDIRIEAPTWSAPMTKDELAHLHTTFHTFIAAPEERKPEMLRKFIEHVQGDARIVAGEDGRVQVPMVTQSWRAVRG